MWYVEENEINVYFLFVYVVRDFSDVELASHMLALKFLIMKKWQNRVIKLQYILTAFLGLNLHISKRSKIYHNRIVHNIFARFFKNNYFWLYLEYKLKNMMKITV